MEKNYMKMPENADEKDDSKRKSRNLSEKKRRDHFNNLVNELNILVSANNKKMDKSTVLKSTISFLRHHNEVSRKSKDLDISEDWKPNFLSNDEFIHLILEALDGFVIIFSTKGDILYISDSITTLLGFLPKELINISLYDICYEMDHEYISKIFSSSYSEKCNIKENTFYCHMKKRHHDYPDRLSYELVKFVGYFRQEIDISTFSRNQKSDLFKNHNFKDKCDTNYDGKPLNLFIGIGRLQTPQLLKQMSIINMKQNEFMSKHSVEWKFLYLDHRAPPIIGYLPFEVLGTSGYDYYHYDDLETILLNHEELIQKGEVLSGFYRFLTKGQQWIWVRTRSRVQYQQSQNLKAEYVVCVHQVYCYSDVIKYSSNELKSFAYTLSSDQEQIQKRKQITYSLNKSKHWKYNNKRFKNSNRNYESDSTSASVESTASINSSKLNLSASQSMHHSSRGIIHLIPSTGVTSLIPQPSCQIAQPAVSHYQIRAPQIVGHTFLEPQQYLAAIPVQPVIPTVPIASTTSIIPSIQSPTDIMSDNVASTSHLQLQRKHDELQKRIVAQQQELKRVSEQLKISRNIQRYSIGAAPYNNKYENINQNLYDISTRYGGSSTTQNAVVEHYDNNLFQRSCGNLDNFLNSNKLDGNQVNYVSTNSNYGSDNGSHDDPEHGSIITSTVTSNDLEILPYQLPQEHAEMFDTSNSSNDLKLNFKNV